MRHYNRYHPNQPEAQTVAQRKRKRKPAVNEPSADGGTTTSRKKKRKTLAATKIVDLGHISVDDTSDSE